MSLARSLTSRMRERFEQASTNATTLPPPSRAYSTKVAGANAAKPFDRRLISLPTELLSTSNSLAYEAPDIKSKTDPKSPTSPRSPQHAPSQPLQPLVTKQQQQQQASPTLTVSSSHSSLRSWEDGLASPHSPALTSASSITSNEYSREPSPASCEANPMSKTFLLDRDQPETPAAVVEDKPAVPQRSSLHTKQSHTMLARARSQSRQPSPRASVDPRPETPTLAESRVSIKSAKSIESKHASTEPPKLPPVSRTSTDFFSSKKLLGEESPFSAELAQVTELVEKYNTNEAGEPAIIDEETRYLIDHGFRCFGANEYIMEIQPLFHRAFGEPGLPVIAEWI